MKKKFFAVILCLAMVLMLFPACKNESKGKFFIGATGPLTGDAADYGIMVQRGAQIAIDEINAAGGLNGIQFYFDMKDDQCDAKLAADGFDALMDAGMQISIGSVTSSACLSFGQKAAAEKLFFITPSASNEDVITDSDYAFRVCFGDPDQGILAAVEITSKYSKIGAIYDNSDTYSSGIYDAFASKMKELGVSFKTETFDAESNKDFSTQVESLKDCDCIFLPIYYTEAGLIAKACSVKGCNAVLFGCDGLDGIAEQIDSSVKNEISYITPFDINSSKAVVSDFVSAFRAKYNDDPNQFAADGYDAVYAIFYAMKAANVSDASISCADLSAAVISAITASGFSYDGVTGNMSWSKSGACNKVPNIVVIK